MVRIRNQDFKRKLIWVSVCLFILVNTLLLSCVQSKDDILKEYNVGFIENNIYYNDFFGFEIPVPLGWVAMDEAYLEELRAPVISEAIGEYLYEIQQRNAKEYRSGGLLTLLKLADNDSLYMEPSFNISNQNVINFPEIVNPSDYFDYIKLEMASYNAVDYTVVEDVKKTTLDETPFYKLTLRYNSDVPLIQEQYAMVHKRFILLIILTYKNDTEKREMHEILDQLKFQ